jgi:hypothetical protein
LLVFRATRALRFRSSVQKLHFSGPCATMAPGGEQIARIE